MFINFNKFVNESITISDAKRFTKLWKNSKMNEYLNTWFKSSYRIYIPLETNIDIKALNYNKELETEIENILNTLGYEIETYIGNLCKKIGTSKNFVKITKVLQKINPNIVEEYNNELIDFGISNNYMVVISRHPIDIAGMSTDRGWTSCMDLNKKALQKEYIAADVVGGTIISYLIKNDDANIQNPISRLLLKPFVDDNKNSWLFPEKVYGTPNKFFEITIENWLKDMQGVPPVGAYKIKGNLYADTGSEKRIFNNDTEKILYYLYEYNISNYKINLDNSVTVLQNVFINTHELQIKLKEIHGNCYVSGLSSFNNFPKLITGNCTIPNFGGNSLRGCSEEIQGSFIIKFNNNINVNLLGFPKKVIGNVGITGSDFSNVKISGHKHLKKLIVGDMFYIQNIPQLEDLTFLPTNLKKLNISYVKILSTKGLNTSKIETDIILKSCEITRLIDFPEIVYGDLDVTDNEIDSGDGFPKIVKGTLHIYGNYIDSNSINTVASSVN
jgi:hypothetical protein